MEKIALLPGGFKPPHAGHYNMAIWLAENTNAEKVIVKVGAKERDGITREISLQLWDLFLKNDLNSSSKKITVIASNSNSPVQDVYDFVENEAPKESTIYLGMGEKDINDARFKNIPKFAEPRGIKFETTLVPPQAGGVSGTKMREFIKNNDKKSFQQYIPEFLTQEQKDQAWGIVSSLEEDLYNPEDKVLDYMKSSEFKAGYTKKNDVPPGYKYRRGGMYTGGGMGYGGMYERDLSAEEERIAQSLPDKEFKKRYGKDWKAVKIATATKMAKKEGMYPPYKADQVQKVRYQASDTFTNSPKDAKKKGYLEGDTYEKMAAKGKKAGNLKQGTVRKRLRIKDGEKIPLSRITKAISSLKKRKSLSDKDKKYLKALNLAKTLKTTTHKENIDPKAQKKYKGKSAPYGSAYEPVNEGRKKKPDPKVGTGKKPKGSGRRLYTDENPSDTVKVKFSTRQDIIDTLNKASFKSKPHKRQSQIINLIHQRVRAALNKAKDPAVKKRLRSGFEYIKKRKEASKKKTQRMKKENVFTKDWWKEIINEILLTEGGAAGHMAHPFNLPNVNNGKQLLDVFEKSADSLDKKPGAIKIDGVNASIRLVDVDGKKQFVMDRGSKKELDLKGITKDDLLDRFGKGHGMVKIGGEVLDMFNEALPAIQNDLKKLGAFNDPNILFNMEYVSGKTNVQDYGANFIAIHGLNKIESKEVQGKRGPLTKRVSSEVSYSKDDLQSLLDNLKPTAKKRGYEVYGSVPTTMKKKPNFNAALSKNYTVNAGESSDTKSLGQWLNELSNIPETDFIFMNIGYKTGSSTVNRKKVGAVSKQVYLAILNKENIDGLFEDAEDRKKAVQGFVTYLATEKLGDEVLKVLDSPMGSADKHEGVVIRDESIAKVPFKITGKFILGGMVSDF